MKKEIINDIEISYPELGFAFNPIRVYVEGIDLSGAVEVVANGVKIEREILEDSVSFELSAIAKSLFKRKHLHLVSSVDLSLCKTLDVQIKKSDIALDFSFNIPVLWGALQIGETYSQNKTLTYFKGFPFTIPLYLEDSLFLQAKIDDNELVDMGAFSPGKFNINISHLNAKESIELISKREEKRGVLDYTFDFTFRPQKLVFHDSLNIKINIVDCPSEGVYLRWINKHGEYNYYLFETGVKSSTTKSSNVVFNNVFYTTDLTDNYHFGAGGSIGKNIEQSQKLFASLIDQDTFDFLVELTESPVVDMFLGYGENDVQNWVSVSITDGTFAKSQAHLQDFELFLIPTKRQVQTL